MRILLVSSSSGSRGGGEIFLLYLAEALKEAGQTVGLWASAHSRMDDLAHRFAPIGEVIREPYQNTYDSWHRGLFAHRPPVALQRIRESWLAWRPDVVHLNKQNLEDGLDLLAAAQTLTTPHLCTVHITQTARFLGARFAAWRDAGARRRLRAYRRPLVAVAPARAAELAAFLDPAADIRTVLNGVPLSPEPAPDRVALRTAEGIPPDAIAIIAVGRLEPQKGPLRFLHQATRIRAAVPAVDMRWIGGGRMVAEWDRDLAARGLQGTVRRIDWRDDIRGALPAYDLMLHTAAYEGLALALLEAMEAGVPCAVEPAVHQQLPAVLQTCSLAVTDDTDWHQLLGDREGLRALGRTARATVRAEFSTIAMGRAYLRIYEELCRNR